MSIVNRKNQFLLSPEERVVRSETAAAVFDQIMTGPLGRWIADGRKAMTAPDQSSLREVIEHVILFQDELGKLPAREILGDLFEALENFVLTMRSLSWSDQPKAVAMLADFSVGEIESVVNRLIDLSDNPCFSGGEATDFWAEPSQD